MNSIFKCSMVRVPNEIEWRDGRKKHRRDGSKMHDWVKKWNQIGEANNIVNIDDLTFLCVGCITCKIRQKSGDLSRGEEVEEDRK